jgi:hypothetical protein
LIQRWARLLVDIDMQHCPNCGAGQLKIIAAILEQPVIELRHDDVAGCSSKPPASIGRQPMVPWSVGPSGGRSKFLCAVSLLSRGHVCAHSVRQSSS